MNKPYFYIIRHKKNKKYYFGCKFSNPDSSNLLLHGGYQTSSKIIKNIIKNEGLEIFEIIKIKHFDTADDVINYEHKFLLKINAAENNNCYNRTNGSEYFRNKGGYSLSTRTKNKMRKPKTKITRDKMSECLKKRDSSVYRKMVKSRYENNEYWNSPETRKKISEANINRFSDEENRLKHSKIMTEYYQENPVSEKTKKIKKEQNSGNSNPMYGKKHREDTKIKMKLAWEKRKNKNI
jgi:hypothetical protein